MYEPEQGEENYPSVRRAMTEMTPFWRRQAL
jgi:hypothetical protein